MSESERDRSVAPKGRSVARRLSRAKQVNDRNVTPPAAKHRRPAKPKKGERVMAAQLAQAQVRDPAVSITSEPSVTGLTSASPDDPIEIKDPWWTEDREKAYQMTLQGLPQHQVAGELQRDRHTIARWLDDDRFANRLYDENTQRFKSTRQRRTMQTVRLTDKAERLANKMLDMADENPKDMNSRLAARDWLSEFRENSRREDEIYGLDKQRVDVNVHGTVQHRHKSAADVGFKAFLTGALKKLGVDPEAEEVDPARADEALRAMAERALSEGSFLDELVEREREEQLAPLLTTTER